MKQEPVAGIILGVIGSGLVVVSPARLQEFTENERRQPAFERLCGAEKKTRSRIYITRRNAYWKGCEIENARWRISQ